MAYFDECVSLSTFDSSDFSSQEDPSQNFVQVGDNMPLPHSSSSISTAGCSGPCLHDNQDSRVTYNSNALEFDASSSTKRPTQAAAILDCKNVEHGGKYRFSFSRKSTEALEVQEDIRKYVRSFGKEREQLDDNAPIGRSKPIDLEKYDEQSKVQSLLFDCVAFKNRLESGSLLLCGGRIANTSSLFASMI
ncbi:uncharacterized protein LOC110814486 [Carica papaya]|uniref:uncharacterized protein LOC110814486 n=1 Tax=Carica papaya TaxID=3649 RepID=UPI000B8C9518|nr:uncharacterized protein LOC110814486 [Carica papaya]XP_021897652.1 uncharacterized protein LOC110814486 [Carica papaya]